MSKRLVSADSGIVPAESRHTRRAALGALAGASLLAIPAIGPTASGLADPVFAAIRRHRSAWKAVGALLPTVDLVAAERSGRPVTQADWEAFERATMLEDRSFEELLATPPTTLAGMRAAISYVAAFEDGYLSESARPFLLTLLKSPLFDGLGRSA